MTSAAPLFLALALSAGAFQLPEVKLPHLGASSDEILHTFPDSAWVRTAEGQVLSDRIRASTKSQIGKRPVRFLQFAFKDGALSRVTVLYETDRSDLVGSLHEVDAELERQLGPSSITGQCWKVWRTVDGLVIHRPYSVEITRDGDTEGLHRELDRVSTCPRPTIAVPDPVSAPAAK